MCRRLSAQLGGRRFYNVEPVPFRIPRRGILNLDDKPRKLLVSASDNSLNTLSESLSRHGVE